METREQLGPDPGEEERVLLPVHPPCSCANVEHGAFLFLPWGLGLGGSTSMRVTGKFSFILNCVTLTPPCGLMEDC